MLLTRSDSASFDNRQEWIASEGIVVRDLALLVAAIETGTLTRAAEAACLTQPAVSKRIAALERRYQVTLLERSRGGVRPTEAGRILYAESRQILAGLERADAAMAELNRRNRRFLRVAASYTVGEILLPDWLAAVRVERPHVLVDAHVGNSADVVGRVLAGAVDLGFVETPDRPDGVEYVQIGEDEIVAVAAPGTELAALSVVTPESLATSTLLLREHGSGTRTAAVRWLEQLGASPSEELALSSTGSLKRAAEAGLGFAMISRFAVERELAAGSLVELPLPRTCPRRPLGAVMRDSSALPAAALGLLEIAKAGVRRGR